MRQLKFHYMEGSTPTCQTDIRRTGHGPVWDLHTIVVKEENDTLRTTELILCFGDKQNMIALRDALDSLIARD
jgi:hypothetical protein